MSVSSPADHLPTPTVPPEPPRGRGRLLTAAGVILAMLMAVLSAVLELLLISVRVGGVLIGVSAVIALVANLFIGWFAYQSTRHKWAAGPPAILWVALVLIAAGRTTEGDYLIASDNWVGWAMIGLGSLAWTIVGIRLVSSPPGKTPF